jgi:hypothetical protein
LRRTFHADVRERIVAEIGRTLPSIPWSRANSVPDSIHKKRPMALYELRTYTLRVGTMVEGGEMRVWSTKPEF